MKKSLLALCFLAGFCVSQAQQFQIEAFSGRNRTAFGESPYSDAPKWYLPWGGRVAFGADHFQAGGEFHQSLTDAEFPFLDGIGTELGNTQFSTTYYGGFLRAKISRYPAMRFGLVLRAGAGMYDTEVNSTVIGVPNGSFDKTLGFNGGAGFSIPLVKMLMLELSYNYHYVKYPGGVDALFDEDFNGSYQSIQLGLSMNFVFGERAKQYQHLKDNWKWRDGWRG